MRIAMIGVGRMGANLARRLPRAGHECVCCEADPRAAQIREKARPEAGR